MAQIKHSMEAILSGKIGGVVFVHMDGETYARSVPRRRKGNWSEKQQLHRQRFKAVNAFCKKFKNTLIPMVWNPASPNKRGYSFFVKANMPAFALDGSLMDARLLQLSTGKLHLPQRLSAWDVEPVEGSEVKRIEVGWQNDPHLEGERLNDQLMVVSSNGSNYSEATATGIRREAMTGSFELPAKPLAATHMYLFFASSDGKDYTASSCFEVGTGGL